MRLVQGIYESESSRLRLHIARDESTGGYAAWVAHKRLGPRMVFRGASPSTAATSAILAEHEREHDWMLRAVRSHEETDEDLRVLEDEAEARRTEALAAEVRA